jgi:hypothetical protein
VSKKNFTIAPWLGENDGEKVILYAPSGMGKTTLASMAPSPVFIGLDDGGRRIRNPKTGEPVDVVQDVETYADVRAVLQSDILLNHQTVVIDTVTVLQDLTIPHMLQYIPHEKGHYVKRLEDYGFGKGYTHMYELMMAVLADLDRLVRRGKNILLLCQFRGAVRGNPSGEDYVKAGPALYPGSKKDVANIQAKYCEWADHIFRIDWENATVTDGKIAPVSTRMVRTHPDATFEAKSRGTLFADYPAVTFSEPSDGSLWRILFGGE